MRKNENAIDRLIRGLLAIIFAVLSTFWLASVWQIVFSILAIVMTITAISGFCGLYLLFKIDTTKFKSNKTLKIALIILLPIVGIMGSYASMFFSKKIFIEDFAKMNDSYKQLLFNSGKDKRAESISYYEKLIPAYAEFQNKYTAYKPSVIRRDAQFDSDLEKISLLLTNLKKAVYSGDLPATHKKLEEVRPIFQDIFKRNGFSMLAVALVDFHDIMEEVIAGADTEDVQKIIDTYPSADEKLKEVEKEMNDASIQAIRKNLDTILDMAKNNKLEGLAKQGADLKSSFVKVYLLRG